VENSGKVFDGSQPGILVDGQTQFPGGVMLYDLVERAC
jgi:hypothetical protein